MMMTRIEVDDDEDEGDNEEDDGDDENDGEQ